MCSWACTAPGKAIKELSARAKVASCPFWSKHLDCWEEDEMKTRCSRNATVWRTTARRYGKMGELWDIQYWRRLKKKKLSGTVTEGSKGGDEIGFEDSHWDQVFYLNAYHMSRKFSSYRFSFKPRMDLDRGSWDWDTVTQFSLGHTSFLPRDTWKLLDHLTSIYLPRQNSHKTSFLMKV